MVGGSWKPLITQTASFHSFWFADEFCSVRIWSSR